MRKSFTFWFRELGVRACAMDPEFLALLLNDDDGTSAGATASVGSAGGESDDFIANLVDGLSADGLDLDSLDSDDGFEEMMS